MLQRIQNTNFGESWVSKVGSDVQRKLKPEEELQRLSQLATILDGKDVRHIDSPYTRIEPYFPLESESGDAFLSLNLPYDRRRQAVGLAEDGTVEYRMGDEKGIMRFRRDNYRAFRQLAEKIVDKFTQLSRGRYAPKSQSFCDDGRFASRSRLTEEIADYDEAVANARIYKGIL